MLLMTKCLEQFFPRFINLYLTPSVEKHTAHDLDLLTLQVVPDILRPDDHVLKVLRVEDGQHVLDQDVLLRAGHAVKVDLHNLKGNVV